MKSCGTELSGLREGLGAAKHLDRERAFSRLDALLKSCSVEAQADVLAALSQIVDELLQGDRWELKLGGLMAAKAMVECCGSALPAGLTEHLADDCLLLLEDDEPRVRLAVASCLKALAGQCGAVVYEQCRDRVLISIEQHFDREGEGSRAGSVMGTRSATGFTSPSGSVASTSSSDLLGALLQSSYQARRPGSGDMRHGTEGWKCLETSMRALQALVQGCGAAIQPHITEDVLELLYRALRHPNRFVRETGFLTLCSVCEALKGSQLVEHGKSMSVRLADGLTDNWSQVRYAACTAARAFMLCMGPEHSERLLPALLGPLCLNRHYVAEGVKQYSQETWRLVTAGQGPQQLARHIEPVVTYYLGQTKATHLAVREAACVCIAELCERVDREAVAPRLPLLLRALFLCGRDSAWPVRDAAGVALGSAQVVLAGVTDGRLLLHRQRRILPAGGWLEDALTLWLAALRDSVASLRDNSAVALTNAARATGEGVTQRNLAIIRERLPLAKTQQTSSSGVRQPLAPEVSYDPEDRDLAMFSSSLVTRFGNQHLVKADGCTDFGEAREPEPWEATDGAVRLLREMASVAPTSVLDLLPLLSDVAHLSSFPNAPNLRETVWQCLPAVAERLGKKAFKPHLELFLPALFADLDNGSHQLAQAAAGACVASLSDLIGPSIFAGRLTGDQQTLMSRSPHVVAVAAPSARLPPTKMPPQ